MSPGVVSAPGQRPALLKSVCSELVWLSRSRRARSPVGFLSPVAGAALGGGEGDSVVPGDREGPAASEEKASLGCRPENKTKKKISKASWPDGQ